MNILHHLLDPRLALAAALINGLLALLVLATVSRASRKSLYVIFLFSCVGNVIWTFGDFMSQHDPANSAFWFHFSLIGTGFLPALFFHFINALVGLTKNRRWIAASYILGLPLALSSALAIYYPAMESFVDGPVWNVLFLILLYSCFSAGMVILAKGIARSKSKSEASRFRYVIVAVCIACFSGTTDLLYIFNDSIPKLGHLGTVASASILAIGVFKHRAAYDLLAEMRMKLDMINELAAGIAHELRNPLSSIKGAASLLRERSGKLTVEESEEYLNLISEEVDRLDAILTNYRGLIRPIKIEREPVLVNGIIEKTVALMRMNGSGPRIELSFSPDVPPCRSDAQTLRQVFINLIRNSLEACGSESVLRIATEHVPPFVKITFRDTGKGVPPEILPHIFEPFVSTKKNSMGLGLAICRRLIDLNGGTITAANEIGGAYFAIHLPTGDEPAPPA